MLRLLVVTLLYLVAGCGAREPIPYWERDDHDYRDFVVEWSRCRTLCAQMIPDGIDYLVATYVVTADGPVFMACHRALLTEDDTTIMLTPIPRSAAGRLAHKWRSDHFSIDRITSVVQVWEQDLEHFGVAGRVLSEDEVFSQDLCAMRHLQPPGAHDRIMLELLTTP